MKHSPTIKDLPLPPMNKTGWPWNRESQKLPNTMPDGTMCPRVTIVTPSYNQGQFLEETIRSVLLQGYPNLEYIIMDGGSTDNSVEIIRKYEPWLAFWSSEPDEGQADAINKGWMQSSGEIVHYLNSDDWLEPNAVSRAVLCFQQHPEASFVSGSCNHTNEKRKVLRILKSSPIKLDNLIFDNYVWQQSTFFRRCVFEEIGYLDIRFHYTMDYEYWVRALLKGKSFAQILGSPIANFRRWSGAKSGGEEQYKKYILDRQNMACLFFGNNTQDYLARIAWAGAYYATAWFEYAMGNTFQALKNFWFSVYIVPKPFLVTRLFDYLFILGKILLWTKIRFSRVKRYQSISE